MHLRDYYIPAESVSAAIPGTGYVRRERRVGHSPLILVHGCAGMGKTVFLAQQAQDWAVPAVYLSLRDEDNSEEFLAAHLCCALSAVTGDDPFGEKDVTVREILAYFIRTAAECGCCVLLDTLDAVTSPAARRILESIIAPAAGGSYRAALAAREVPSFLVRWILGDSCCELGTDALLFTVEETAMHISRQLPPDCAVLNTASGLPLPAVAESLHAFACGWPAAEAMILKEIPRAREKELHLASAAERSHLRSYIAYSILDTLDTSLASYICQTAFLRRCDTEMCRAVLHRNTGGEELSYLHSHGILVLPETAEDYPVYAPAVRQALAGLLSSSERRRLTDAAVRHYAENNRMADALSLLEECGDADTAENLLIRCGGSLIENREFELIGYCADIIERYRMPSDASALGILGQYYYYKGEYPAMERAFNMADSMFGKENLYSVWRGLYNGILKFDKNPPLYTANICRFTAYLRENGHPLPFLYPEHQAQMEKVLRQNISPEEKPIRIRRFGNFTVTLSAEKRDIPWRTKKACEFMAFMLERDGKPLDRDHLMDALWHQSMPESAVAMLHNIIYSLRREFRDPVFRDFISYKNKCYGLDMSLIADDLEEILSICRAVGDHNVSEILAHSELFSAYWGKYLANLDCEWANNLREHYDRAFVDGCLILAAHCHAGTSYAKELIFLQNAAEIDPYSERIVREILYCHAAMGYPNKAKGHYDKYCALIGEELGIEPSKWLKKEFLACFYENRT